MTTYSHTSTQETFWAEMTRNGSSLTLKLYSDEYSTLIEEQTHTISGTIEGLQYFKASIYDEGSSMSYGVDIDDVLLTTSFSDTTGTMFSFENTSGENILYEVEADKLRVAKEALASSGVTHTSLNTGTNEGNGVYKTTVNDWDNIGISSNVFKIGGDTKVSLKTTSPHLEFGFIKTSTTNVSCFECNSNAYPSNSGYALVHPQAGNGWQGWTERVAVHDGVTSGGGGWGSDLLGGAGWDASSYTTGTEFTLEIKPNGDIEFSVDGVVKHTWTGFATGNEFYFYNESFLYWI